MKAVAATFVETVLPAEALADRPRSTADSRFADYLQLVRPRVAIMVLVTFVLYVFAYTPAKRTTTLNTLIGAVPGALPPVIGWTAVTGRIDAGAVALFLIVFVWQVPHFLAIAWMYREDYRRAGLKMLPVNDPAGDE